MGRRQIAPSWETIQQMEQARYMRLARDHAHENHLCEIIAGSGTITQADAAVLGRLATENGWDFPSVGRAAAARRRKRQSRI